MNRFTYNKGIAGNWQPPADDFMRRVDANVLDAVVFDNVEETNKNPVAERQGQSIRFDTNKCDCHESCEVINNVSSDLLLEVQDQGEIWRYNHEKNKNRTNEQEISHKEDDHGEIDRDVLLRHCKNEIEGLKIEGYGQNQFANQVDADGNSRYIATLLFFSTDVAEENSGITENDSVDMSSTDYNSIKHELDNYGNIKVLRRENSTVLSMIQEISRIRPQMVHIDTHGKGDGGMAFRKDVSRSNLELRLPEELHYIWNLFSSYLKFVYFDACYSMAMAQVASGNSLDVMNTRSDYIDVAIGVDGKIEVGAARFYARTFYHNLVVGKPIVSASHIATEETKKWCESQENEKRRRELCLAEEWSKIKMLVRHGIKAEHINFFANNAVLKKGSQE